MQATQEQPTPTLGAGVVVVVNRRSVEYEGMFDGVCHVFKAHERKMMMENVGNALAGGSALRLNLATGVPNTYALGLEGRTNCDPLDGDIADTDPVEKLDRSGEAKLTETEPMALTADGEMSLGVGKAEKTGGNKAKKAKAPPADEMKPLSFVNPEEKTGPQNDSGFTDEQGGSRVIPSRG